MAGRAPVILFDPNPHDRLTMRELLEIEEMYERAPEPKIDHVHLSRCLYRKWLEYMAETQKDPGLQGEEACKPGG